MKKSPLIKNDNDISIGKNIKKVRVRLGIKAIDLIRQVHLMGVDLNTSSLSKIEAGTQHITASQFKAICHVLQCEYEELLAENNISDLK